MKSAYQTLTGVVLCQAITALDIKKSHDPANSGQVIIHTAGSSHIFYVGPDYQEHYDTLLMALNWVVEPR